MWPSKLGRTGNRNLVAIRPEKLNYWDQMTTTAWTAGFFFNLVVPKKPRNRNFDPWDHKKTGNQNFLPVDIEARRNQK
jgi:hypothetical protein